MTIIMPGGTLIGWFPIPIGAERETGGAMAGGGACCPNGAGAWMFEYGCGMAIEPVPAPRGGAGAIGAAAIGEPSTRGEAVGAMGGAAVGGGR